MCNNKAKRKKTKRNEADKSVYMSREIRLHALIYQLSGKRSAVVNRKRKLENENDLSFIKSKANTG